MNASNLRQGDQLLIYKRSWLLGKFSLRKVAVYIGNGRLVVKVPGGPRLKKLTNYKWYWYQLKGHRIRNINKFSMKGAEGFISRELGRDFVWSQLFASVLRKLSMLDSISDWSSAAMVSAEFAAKYYQNGGLNQKLNPAVQNPEDRLKDERFSEPKPLELSK